MQTLARVNRTFRDKPDGLLVAYAPLVENLNQALAEYTKTDREKKPVGQEHRRGGGAHRERCSPLDELCSGYDWRVKARRRTTSWMKAAVGLTNYLRSPSTPGNQVPRKGSHTGDRFRKLANRLSRAWALCAGSQTLEALRPTAKFYEEVRVWMAKFDAQERQAPASRSPKRSSGCFPRW